MRTSFLDPSGRRSAGAGLALGASVILGCAGSTTPVALATDGGPAVPSAAQVVVNATDFDCILRWEKVRGFRMKRIGGGALSESLAVANSAEGGTYPPGTVLQLVPTEAMVKREPGFSPATKDWEFFFLEATKSRTSISARGTTDVKNGFGGNCFDCHNKAEPKWDLVCESTHGCAPLPIGAATIQNIQNADPRCP